MSNFFQAIPYVGKAFDEVLRTRGPSRRVIVPPLVGLSVPDMWVVALRAGVRVNIRHVTAERPTPGRIVVQTPTPGTRVRRNSVVDLDVAFETVEGGNNG